MTRDTIGSRPHTHTHSLSLPYARLVAQACACLRLASGANSGCVPGHPRQLHVLRCLETCPACMWSMGTDTDRRRSSVSNACLGVRFTNCMLRITQRLVLVSPCNSHFLSVEAPKSPASHCSVEQNRCILAIVRRGPSQGSSWADQCSLLSQAHYDT